MEIRSFKGSPLRTLGRQFKRKPVLINKSCKAMTLSQEGQPFRQVHPENILSAHVRQHPSLPPRHSGPPHHQAALQHCLPWGSRAGVSLPPQLAAGQGAVWASGRTPRGSWEDPDLAKQIGPHLLPLEEASQRLCSLGKPHTFNKEGKIYSSASLKVKVALQVPQWPTGTG